uniref:Meiosis-specific with OB domain-containing protein-like n=1 Tax=Cyprinus carpio TaxID=7962 RepID=A0A8C1JF47_CYPCA
GKTDSRGFPDRKNAGSERFTFSFTIKDSPEHFINVSAWGNEAYIQGLSSRFQIGDCVVIENPLVVTKDYEKEERFCPSTPSSYRLFVTETHSSIRICSDLETEARILPLFHMPIKDLRDFYSLGDITANGQSLDGHIINILAAPSSMMQISTAVTLLFSSSWDKETIRLVQTVTQRETVLFIADARITFDSFRNCRIATATSKTIITLNPDTAEANQLYTCIRELLEAGGLDDQDILSGDSVRLDSISDVLTVNQLKARSHEHGDVFHCITYGFITNLELSSSMSKVIRKRCAKCKFLINEESQTCSNDACPNQGQQYQATEGFELLVDISDHTGTLHSCNLAGTVAEKTLGCKVLPSTRRSRMRASILSCALADPVEVKQKLASFVA